MKILLVLASALCLAHGLPTDSSPGIELLNFLASLKTAADSLEAFPWIKASQVKTRFGTSTPSPIPTTASTGGPTRPSGSTGPAGAAQPQQQSPILTDEILQSYLAALAARLQPSTTSAPQEVAPLLPPAKHPLKAKVPKQLKPQDGSAPSTTESFLAEEKKQYPDSLYDEFYLDWLRKRQIPEITISTPSPDEPSYGALPQSPPPASNPALLSPYSQYPYPSMPLQMTNPFANPFLYPFAGLKVSKAMVNAQATAALAAMNITTTPKPMKLKLKLSIPAGGDVAGVITSGLAGFPVGTTYELAKK